VICIINIFLKIYEGYKITNFSVVVKINKMKYDLFSIIDNFKKNKNL